MPRIADTHFPVKHHNTGTYFVLYSEHMLNRRAIIDVLIVVMTTAAFVIGMCAARQVGYDAGVASVTTAKMQTPTDMESITGAIIDITDTTITLETLFPRTTRTVITDSATVFERVVPKDQKTYQNEVNAFNVRIKTAGATGPLFSMNDFKDIPVPFTFVPITLADLDAGETVTITATGNILSKNQFTATRVTLKPATPIAPSQ